MEEGLTKDRNDFFAQFVTDFFSVDGIFQVTTGSTSPMWRRSTTRSSVS